MPLNKVLFKEQPLLENSELLKTPSIFLVLLIPFLMLATRTDHFGSAVSLPDASLAVFFLAGLYLRRCAVFILLCALAAGIDYWAITARGVSDFCVTAAYGFLLPAYFSVWWAGRWARTNNDNKILLVTVTIASVLVAFLISNGSFYLFSGHFAELSLAEYAGRVAQYLPRYLITPICYLGVAALFHALMVKGSEQSKFNQFDQ
jgi:hypothetical protein